MNRIFIEAKNANTSEHHFLRTVLSKYFGDMEMEFVFMDGVGNLFGETIQNQIRLSQDEGNSVLVILDADFAAKGWGYARRHEDVMEKMRRNGLDFPLFLYPNNSDDGDVETLLESLARKDLHRKWWDCFDDYEACVLGVRDDNGQLRYNIPNRKAKLHTYISSQRLSNRQRDKIGRGHWLFDDAAFWDLDRAEIKPLVEFLKANLK